MQREQAGGCCRESRLVVAAERAGWWLLQREQAGGCCRESRLVVAAERAGWWL
jgi:hypothetical protein